MNRLKELRLKKSVAKDGKRLTQAKLVEELNNRFYKDTDDNKEKFSKMNISNWENNKHRIKPEKAQQLADYFGVSVGHLLGYDTDEALLDNLLEKLMDLSPEERTEYAKTAEYLKERELIETLEDEIYATKETRQRKLLLGDISGLLKGLDLGDLHLVNSFVERLYFSEYSLDDNDELENTREQLRKEIEQLEK